MAIAGLLVPGAVRTFTKVLGGATITLHCPAGGLPAGLMTGSGTVVFVAVGATRVAIGAAVGGAAFVAEAGTNSVGATPPVDPPVEPLAALNRVGVAAVTFVAMATVAATFPAGTSVKVPLAVSVIVGVSVCVKVAVGSAVAGAVGPPRLQAKPVTKSSAANLSMLRTRDTASPPFISLEHRTCVNV